MSIERLSCNACGAPLEVPASANYVTCNHCHSQLTIRRQENITFTESLERLTEKTDQLADRVDDLTSVNEVAALDRKWELDRENFMITGKHGNRSLPTTGSAIGGGIAIAAFGIFWTAMAFGITSSAPSFGPFGIAKIAFPLFGVIFVCAGIASSVSAYSKAENYRKAERRYRQKRNELSSKR